MTFTSYPFDNADTDEAQYTLMFREFASSGVLATFGSSAMLVTGSGSALEVSIAAGDAFVRGHMGRNSSAYTLAVPANATGSTRLDRVVLQLDPSANSIIPVYKTGTTSLPALVQNDTTVYELPLATLAVPHGAGNVAGVVTDDRRWCDAKVGVFTTAGRPTNPRQGDGGLNVTTDTWEYWDGDEWKAMFAPITAVSTWTSITGTGYQLAVSTTAPASPTATTIWIKPLA